QGNYRGPLVLPQGEIKPFWTMDLGAKQDIINNKGTISLNVSDIFTTGSLKVYTEDERFVQDRIFNREPRIATLSFSYRFGGFQERRNNRQREAEGGMDEDMGF